MRRSNLQGSGTRDSMSSWSLMGTSEVPMIHVFIIARWRIVPTSIL